MEDWLECWNGLQGLRFNRSPREGLWSLKSLAAIAGYKQFQSVTNNSKQLQTDINAYSRLQTIIPAGPENRHMDILGRGKGMDSAPAGQLGWFRKNSGNILDIRIT